MSSPVLGLELADAEKGCSSGEGHLSVLRRIAEKLSSDSLAKNAKDALNVLFGKCNCRIHRALEASAWKLYEGDWTKLLSMHMFFWCFLSTMDHGYPLNKLDWDTLKRIQRQQFQNRRVLNHSGDPFPHRCSFGWEVDAGEKQHPVTFYDFLCQFPLQKHWGTSRVTTCRRATHGIVLNVW